MNPDRDSVSDGAKRDEHDQRSGREVLSRGDHVAGERCRASAAVLCRPARLTLDVDYSPNDAFRVVQLTLPGSGCSIQIGRGRTREEVVTRDIGVGQRFARQTPTFSRGLPLDPQRNLETYQTEL